jgi:hypothetical protein
MILEGTIVKGLRSASRVLPSWLPKLAQYHNELTDSYHGTINVDVGDPIDLKIDFRTPSIDWFPQVEFIRIRLEFPIGNISDAKAWIYQPYGYHWGVLNKKNLVEIFAKYIDGVKLGQPCRIHVLNGGIGDTSTSPHYLSYSAAKK